VYEIAGCREVGEVCAQPIAAAAVEVLDRAVLDGAVHSFDLAVHRGWFGLVTDGGMALFMATLKACMAMALPWRTCPTPLPSFPRKAHTIKSRDQTSRERSFQSGNDRETVAVDAWASASSRRLAGRSGTAVMQ
jgi:hypothetical protein